MNVLVYSYFPLRSNHWAGGAQAFIDEVLPKLLERGFRFRVVSPRVSADDVLLNHPGLENISVLDEPSTGPLKLDVRSRNLSHFRQQLSWANVVWTIDEPFPLRIRQPVVSTLQTADGFEENQSILAFNWDVLVAASPFLGKCVREITENHWEDGLSPEVRVVNNGINLERFRPTNGATLARHLGLPIGKKFLLFPHRPEPEKGFDIAIEIMRQLARRGNDYLLLIPMGPKCVSLSQDNQSRFYSNLQSQIISEHLEGSIFLHDWISPQDMPAYFSLGHCCLTLSRLPEGFGFVPVQSIACGTPVISTKCGALRGLFPHNHGLSMFSTDQVDQMLHAISAMPIASELESGRRYIQEHYSIDTCVANYANVLSTAVPRRAVQGGARNERIRVTPWWFRERRHSDGRVVIWHDLQMKTLEVSAAHAEILATIESTGAVPSDRLERNDIEILMRDTLIAWS